jgi:hypothetical protein
MNVFPFLLFIGASTLPLKEWQTIDQTERNPFRSSTPATTAPSMGTQPAREFTELQPVRGEAMVFTVGGLPVRDAAAEEALRRFLSADHGIKGVIHPQPEIVPQVFAHNQEISRGQTFYSMRFDLISDSGESLPVSSRAILRDIQASFLILDLNVIYGPTTDDQVSFGSTLILETFFTLD